MEISLIFVFLAVGTHAWPQIPNDSSIKGVPVVRSLPLLEDDLSMDNAIENIPVASSPVADTKSAIHDTSKRNLPVIAGDLSMDNAIQHITVATNEIDRHNLSVIDHGDSTGLLERRNRKRGHFALPLIHAPRHALGKRTFEMTIENRTDLAYYAPLMIGNPPQTVYAQADTGSFELWVDPDCSKLQASNREFCERVGQYNAEQSHSARPLNSTRQIKYGKGSANISYYLDDIALSDDLTLKGVQFGVAESSVDQDTGVLGLGKGQGAFVKYNTFLDDMFDQGFMKSRVFSVGLGSKQDGAGSIAFGGVDTKKFSGNLAKLPAVRPSPDGMPRYWANMKSISQLGGNAYKGSNIPVFFDTGSTLCLLPPPVVDAIAKDLGSKSMDSQGYYRVDCAWLDKSGTVDFEFEGVTIKIGYSEIIRHLGNICWLGLRASTKFSLLGDTFLRSAYVVFDNDADDIYLAQYNDCGTNVETIYKSSDIKGIKGVCDSKLDKPSSVSTTSQESTQLSSSITTTLSTTSASSAVISTPTSINCSDIGGVSPSGTADDSGEPTGLDGGDSEGEKGNGGDQGEQEVPESLACQPLPLNSLACIMLSIIALAVV